MTHVAWVVGRGGLLGSQVEQAAAREGAVPFIPSQPFPWLESASIDAALTESALAFVRHIELHHAERWALYWCAGAGVVATPETALLEECRTFDAFLQAFGAALASSPHAARSSGRYFLASSAGGVHAGNEERPVTERCVPAPISPYGRAKLRQETALEAWLASRPAITAWVGRLSNLYGPGQNMTKPQGLVSHMSRSVIHNVPIHIYVPLDTLRDYLFVPDAARAIVRWTARDTDTVQRFTVKLCASEQDTTIGTLIGLFRRLARRHVRVVSALHPVQNQQPSVLQFRSVVWPDDPIQLGSTLASGIERVYRGHLMLHAQGRLPPPSPARV